MASYPTTSKSFSTKVDGVDLVQAAHINDIQAEVKAVEDQLIASKLATLTSAPAASKVLTTDGSGVPTWAAKAPDADKLDGIDSAAFYQIPTPSTWTPTTVGWSSFIANVCKYILIGKICIFYGRISGISNNTATTITLPFTSANINGIAYGGVLGALRDNDAYQSAPGRWTFGANTNVMVFYKDMLTGTWTASGTKEVAFFGVYEIA